jgi:acyl-CoA dehydrogenase
LRGVIRQEIAKSYIGIEQACLLTLKAADALDKVGNKQAADLIAAITIVAPHNLRIADGRDEVHMAQLGRMKIKQSCDQ